MSEVRFGLPSVAVASATLALAAGAIGSQAAEVSPESIAPGAFGATPELASASKPNGLITGEIIGKMPGPDIPQSVLPAEVQKIIRRDTVKLGELGCSGRLVRDAHDSVLGVATAEHCHLRDGAVNPVGHHRYKGTDGNTYIVEPQPIWAKTGAWATRLKSIAEIDQFVVPVSGDASLDLALGVAKNHTADEVVSAYNNTLAKTVPSGKNIYMGGLPEYQPNNNTKVQQRQEFKMTYVGDSFMPVGSNSASQETLHLRITNTARTVHGAVCSYGASGSEAFVMINHKPRSIGVLSSFNSSIGAIPDIAYGTDKIYKSPLSHPGWKIAARCGFSYESASTNNGWSVLQVVKSEKEIPGYVSPEQARDNARNDFKDPSVSKQVIDGLVGIPSPKSADGYVWVNRPMIFYGQKYGGAIIGWSNMTESDNLILSSFENHLEGIKVYPNIDAETAPLLDTNGPITYFTKATAKENWPDIGGFNDANNLSFGQPQNAIPDTSNRQPLMISVVDGKIVIEPLKK